LDAVRSTYRELTDAEKREIDLIKNRGLAFLDAIRVVELEATREGRIAITKIEEAVMWAVKGITG
jgi:hypothetical protein